MTRPLQLLGGILLACLERGRLQLVQLLPKDLATLVRCIILTRSLVDSLLISAIGVRSAIMVGILCISFLWKTKRIIQILARVTRFGPHCTTCLLAAKILEGEAAAES